MSWLLISNNSVLLDEHSIFDQHLLLRLAEIWCLNFFFLYTFCKIKSPRFFCCCWSWVSTLLLYLKKLIFLPNIITPCSLWTSFTQFLPVKIFHWPTSFFYNSPSPTPPVGDARSTSLFVSKGSLIALMSYSEYLPCVYLLSSFKVNVRFYFRKRLLFLYLA